MSATPEIYKGYEITWDGSVRLYKVDKAGLHTQMKFRTTKAAKTAIDTYERRVNKEVREGEVYYPPISEDKLNEIINRPKAEYSNNNFNK